jgi:type I restriction enzyme S subunit
VQRGDAFVIRGNGNRLLCGKAGLSNQSYGDLFYPDLLIRLRFDQEKILPEFAVAQWNLPSVHARLSTRAKSSNGIWKINGQDIRFHMLCVPPITQQLKVIKELALLRTSLNNVQERQNTASRIMSSVFEKINNPA